MSFTYAPRALDDELFELMGKAGCTFVSLGNESVHELILRNLRKGFTLDNIMRAARRARENGLSYGCFLLLGGPGETRDTVERSIAFVDELHPDIVTVKAGIRIYPGTPLEAIARWRAWLAVTRAFFSPPFTFHVRSRIGCGSISRRRSAKGVTGRYNTPAGRPGDGTLAERVIVDDVRGSYIEDGTQDQSW